MSELSNAVSTAEIAAAEWRAKLGKIQTAMNAAKAVLNSSDARRGRFALDAATGNAEAAQSMAKIRRENDAAEKDLADLQLALPEATRQLAAAEATLTTAKKALAKNMAQDAMRKRIAAAALVDEALAHLVRKIAEWDSHGEEIKSYYADTFGGQVNMTTLDNATGLNRLLAALPPVFGKLFPSVSRGSPSSLAASEANMWGMAESAKKTA